jgi:hypothetical protein
MSARRGVMRDAVAFPLDRPTVEGCLLDTETDRLFARACETSIQDIDLTLRRGRLAHVTGHMAESVGELLWVDLGYNVVWHLTGPGTHGVDIPRPVAVKRHPPPRWATPPVRSRPARA